MARRYASAPAVRVHVGLIVLGMFCCALVCLYVVDRSLPIISHIHSMPIAVATTPVLVSPHKTTRHPTPATIATEPKQKRIIHIAKNYDAEVVFFCPFSTKCRDFAASQPGLWWKEIQRHGFFVVFLTHSLPDPNDSGWRQLRSQGLPFEFRSVPDEKQTLTAALHHNLNPSPPENMFLIVASLHTYLVPSRLRQALQQMDITSDRVYVGRPEVSDKNECGGDQSVSFCSPWLFVTTTATIHSLPSAIVQKSTDSCLSPGSAMGFAMQSKNLKCEGLLFDKSAPRPGTSWQTNTDGLRLKQKHQLCAKEDDHDVITQLSEEESQNCIGFHPLTKPHQLRLVHYKVFGLAEEYTQCTMGLVIPSTISEFQKRQTVRLTWKPLAEHLGVKVRFFVGQATGNVKLARHMISHEPDVISVPSTSDMTGLVLAGLTHFTKQTECAFVAIAHPDTYIRPYQLVDSISAISSTSAQWLGLVFHHPSPESHKDPAFRGLSFAKQGHLPPHMCGTLSVLTRAAAHKLQPHLEAVNFLEPYTIAVGEAVSRLGGEIKLTLAPGLSLSVPCSATTAFDHPGASKRLWNVFQRHECELNGQFCECVGARPGLQYPGMVKMDTFGLHGLSSDPDAKFSKSIPPWKDKSLVPTTFQFMSSELEKSAFEGRMQHWQDMKTTLKAYLDTLHVSGPQLFAVCVTCREGWRSVVFEKSHVAVSFLPALDDSTKFREVSHIAFPKGLPFDVVVPFACQTKRLQQLIISTMASADELEIDLRVVIAWSECPDHPEERMDEVLVGFLSEHPEWAELVSVVQGPPSFSRGPSLNAGIAAARDDAIVIALDVDMTILTTAFTHCHFFSHQTTSLYFPIVFSEFEPSSVKLVQEFFGSEIGPSSPFRGTWRPYGYGMFCGWATDVKTLQFEDMHGWGGEDNAFYSLARSRFSIVRLQDISFTHAWHEKNCQMANEDSYRSCLASVGANSKSSLAWHLEREALKERQGDTDSSDGDGTWMKIWK